MHVHVIEKREERPGLVLIYPFQKLSIDARGILSPQHYVKCRFPNNICFRRSGGGSWRGEILNSRPKDLLAGQPRDKGAIQELLDVNAIIVEDQLIFIVGEPPSEAENPVAVGPVGH